MKRIYARKTIEQVALKGRFIALAPVVQFYADEDMTQWLYTAHTDSSICVGDKIIWDGVVYNVAKVK